jgi:hypothetical protein
MKWTGWIFLIVCWGVVIYWTAWCMIRVLSSKKHWTQPEEDIKELHHGEYGEETPGHEKKPD